MDRYDEMPWWCQLLWDRSGRPWYEEIDDPAAFLASIRQQLAGQVDELTDELAGDDRAGEGYLGKAGGRGAGPPPATRPKRSAGTSTARSYQTRRPTATSRPLPENGRQSSGVPIRRGRRSMPSERYGRVIWDTCWTTDRVLNRGSGRFASCGSAREGLESPRSKDARDVVVVTQLRRTLRNGGAGWPNPVTRSARRIARRGLCSATRWLGTSASRWVGMTGDGKGPAGGAGGALWCSGCRGGGRVVVVSRSRG